MRAAALLAWAWQGLALAAVVAALLRMFRSLSATTRHVAWWLALAGILALPLVSAGLRAAAPGGHAGAIPTDVIQPGALLTVPLLPAAVATFLLWLWLGLVIQGLVRVGLGVAQVQRLKHRSRPVPSRVLRRLRLWSGVRTSGRLVTLRLSDHVDVPCALGLGSAVILLPRCLVDAVGDDVLDQVVLHEHAHLARRDDWWRLVQALIESIVGVHPAVRWVGRQIEFEREVVCDDAVVAVTGRPGDYARGLSEVGRVSVALAANRGRPPALVPGAVRSASMLRRRVTRLLDGRRNGSIEPAWIGLAAGVAGLGVLVISLGQAPPIVAFRDQPVGVAPEAASSPALAARRAPVRFPEASASRADVRAAEPLIAHDSREGRAAADSSGRHVLRGRPAHVELALVAAPSVSVEAWANADEGSSAHEPLVAVSRFETLLADTGARASLARADQASADAGVGDGPWAPLADAGVDIGSASKKSGLVVARFFTRAGQSLAGAF